MKRWDNKVKNQNFIKREIPYYRGHAVIKNELNAETADERYYEFIGKSSVYPVSEIVHPEQREMFLDAFYKAQKGIEDSFLYIKLCDEAGDRFV